MKASCVLAVLFVLLGGANLQAQQWATKMFKATVHDFGTVARGAKAEFVFEFENIYEEEVHIASIRSSCGCTTPRLTKDTLKTFEKSSVVATYNTRSFYGAKSATITLVIDKPYPAEVQLSVSGYIRSDVVFNPGVVSFGSVEQGAGGERRIDITYAGRTDWSITDVRSSYGHVQVQLSDAVRVGNQTKYEMVVQLTPDAPPGLVSSELSVVTDDANLRSFPLALEATILSPLSISPATISMGVVKPGQKVTKQLLVRAKTPFKITGINCEDCIEAKLSSDAKKLHIVPITYVAGEGDGAKSHRIEIQTDLGSGLTAACQAKATVRSQQ